MIKRLPFLLALALLNGCGKPAPPAPPTTDVERIVSLAPNITETIYALGLGDKLVGTTLYCTYPAAARSLPKIGGFGQINYEAVVALKPDLVILHKEWDTEKARLTGLGIPTLETGSYFIADILKSITDIGNACGAPERAAKLIQALESRIDEIRLVGHPAVAGQSAQPGVLILFGSDSTGPFQAFGPACIHTEILAIAGGQNVVEGALPFATLSREAVIRLNPDIIIVLAPELETADGYSRDWGKLGSVSAVQHNRIHILTADYTCIPGPRFIQTLEDFSGIVRP